MTPGFERQQFEQAIDFYKGKIALPSSGWTDIYQEQHSHGFVVAGAANDALLGDMYNAIYQAWTDGTGYPAFRTQFEQIASKYGWAYKGAPGWRSKVIYQTNISTSYSAGRYQQMMALKELRPYWMYVHTSVEHPRLQHLAWDGLILPANDPWFDTHFPPNGWGCKCKIDPLSRTEAADAWSAKGRTGPDDAPPVEWQERTIGARGSNPQTVLVPKGIDPGFAYNPGKAWLEPHTVPPLTGYDAVLKERGAAWPTGFKPPPIPLGTVLHKSVFLAENTPPAEAVNEFLGYFNADLQNSSVLIDSAGTPVAIGRALFIDGTGQFKWLSEPGKISRLKSIRLLAMTLADPDEIWWSWEQSRDNPAVWLLKRRYLRVFKIEDSGEFGIVAFEWGANGWSGSTAFMPDRKQQAGRQKYFNKQRVGRLIYRRK